MRLDATRERIEGMEYPLSTDEAIDRIGDAEIELVRGTETVADVLEPLGTETFETPEDVRLALRSAVSDAAIGCKGYSDRDPDPLGALYRTDPVSF